MDPKPMIRAARPDDLSVILKLGATEPGFEVSDKLTFYESDLLEAWLASPGEDVLLVAEADGEVRGFLACVVGKPSVTIENIVVEQAFRSQGIGSELLDQCIISLQARQITAKHVNALIREGNLALDFFKDHGFKVGYSFSWATLSLSTFESRLGLRIEEPPID
jgi:ribosomal protein S18 acetylase RimI-like enzyme